MMKGWGRDVLGNRLLNNAFIFLPRIHNKLILKQERTLKCEVIWQHIYEGLLMSDLVFISRLRNIRNKYATAFFLQRNSDFTF